MMSNQEFIAAFTAGQLAPEGFDHRAHLRTAGLLLQSCRQDRQAGPHGRHGWLRK
jgi:hypothetical protein